MDDDDRGYYVTECSGTAYAVLTGVVKCSMEDARDHVKALCNGHLDEIIDIEDYKDGGIGVEFTVTLPLRWTSGSFSDTLYWELMKAISPDLNWDIKSSNPDDDYETEEVWCD